MKLYEINQININKKISHNIFTLVESFMQIIIVGISSN